MQNRSDDVLDRASRVYGDRIFEHTASFRHQGSVIALAMDEQRRLVYVVLDPTDEGGDAESEAFDADYWPAAPRPLVFSWEIAQVGFGVVDSRSVPVFRQGSRRPEPPRTVLLPPGSPNAPFPTDYFLSTTARLTELAPFHAMSDGRHVYVFRQAIGSSHPDMIHVDAHGQVAVLDDTGEVGFTDDDGKWVPAGGEFFPVVDSTLLVDRFVLIDGSLRPTVEVRYQRSRNKSRPQSPADNLGAKDLDDRLFHEPTQELAFVRNLSAGRFTPLLIPTRVADTQRWQIFAHNGLTGRLDSYSVERSADGLFNTRGTPTYTCVDHPSVFALGPDECSEPTSTGDTCGRPLVPRVSASGHAECALRFGPFGAQEPTGEVSWIELEGSTDPRLLPGSGEFTLEAWLRPDADDEPPPLQTLVGGGNRGTSDAGLWVWIIDGVKLRIGFGDGNQWNQFTTEPALTSLKWNHVAVALSGQSSGHCLTWSIDGRERGHTTSVFTDEAEMTSQEIAAGPTQARLITSIASPEAGFSGTIDEVRLWQRTRSEDELREGMSHRLTGHEPGLAAYWRFDEATSDAVRDMTDHGYDGIIHGASWTRSDAPIGEHPGLTRASVQLVDGPSGRTLEMVDSPTALLYFQQSLAAGGYSGSDKPLKNAGRVMVALPTPSEGESGSGTRLAILDMGVSPSGRLAQSPDVVHLRGTDDSGSLQPDLVSIDGDGLTTVGASLDFANAPRGAFLLDGADGKLGLFFAGDDDKFSVAYFDTLTDQLRVGLTDDSGAEVVTCQGTLGEHTEDLTIAVTDVTGPTGTVRVRSAGLEECWTSVPLIPSELVAVLNGERKLPSTTTRSLTISATPSDGQARPKLLFPPNGLPAGSMLLRAVVTPQPAHRQTEAAIVEQHQSSASRQRTGGWTNASSGKALRVSKSCYATALSGSTTADFASADDLTVEAWLQPRLEEGRGLLAERQVRSVFRIPPRTLIQIDSAPQLNFSGPITIEAWVRVTKERRGLQNIVAHGYHLSPNGEVFLRLNGMWDLRYEIGSWDGSDHLVSFPVPPEDIGHWAHLAGVYDGESWRLYRNGVQVASRRDATGAVTVDGTPWQIGASANPKDPRWFDGWVDDVRIWSTARTTDEILDHLGTPLATPNAESTLAGYWCGRSGAKDRSAHAGVCRYMGKAKVVKQTLPEVYYERAGMSILRHVSARTGDNSRRSYELRLEARHQQLAKKHERMVFALVKKAHIQIDPAPKLDFAGPITLEAWVRVDISFKGIHNIVAHGYRRNPDAEVFLRYHNMRYQVGSWDGADHLVSYPVPASDLGRWVHLAGVYDGQYWRLYRDGVEVAAGLDGVGAVLVDGTHWNIGSSAYGKDPRYLFGWVDDVRIWSVARTADQIKNHLGTPIAEPKRERLLAGNWCGSDNFADRSANPSTCRKAGIIAPTSAELPDVFAPEAGIYPVAEVNGLRVRSNTPLEGWGHLAATYRQSFAIKLRGEEYLECADDAGLDIADDLTIEVFGQIEDLGDGSGLLVKGTPAPGTEARIPYALAIDAKGILQFSFEDVNGGFHEFTSEKPIQEGTPFRAAVSRKRTTQTVGEGAQTRTVTWHEIVIRLEDENGSIVTATHCYTHPDVTIANGVATVKNPNAKPMLSPSDIGRGAGQLVIGRSYLGLDGKRPVALRGILSEIRIWNAARVGIVANVHGKESDLVSRWPFIERVGPTVADVAGSADARVIGFARWCHDPDPRGSTLRLFLNGIATSSTAERVEGTTGDLPFVLFSRQSEEPNRSDGFTGDIDEVRVWRTERSPVELRDNMFRRVTGEGADQLIVYFPFDEMVAETSDGEVSTSLPLLDRSGSNHHMELFDAEFAISDAPVGDDCPQVGNALALVRSVNVIDIRSRPSVAEYGEVSADAAATLTGTLKRCYSVIRSGGDWELITGFKVGDLTTEWVSQVQFDPQLIGFIEGAPPVPRENLGQRAVPGIGDIDDYNEASTVRLQEADSTRLSYSVDLDHGFDQQWDMALGAVFRTKAEAGFGYVQEVFKMGSFVGAHTKFDNTYSWLQEDTTEAVDTTRRSTALELRGRITEDGFLPDNVGLALVESETADLYAMRLRRNNALVGYHLRPNADIPPDWNIIHFGIDPTYSKQGTLDGYVGIRPDDHYPNAGSRGDASYYKPKEAYRLKRQITENEQRARLDRFYRTDIAPGPGRESLPDLAKRNIVNTYVWTADGGLFEETEEMMDTLREVKGGSYRFLGLAGAQTEMMFAATVGTKFCLDALFGGHRNRVKTRTKDSTRSFSVDVSVDKVERDVYERDAEGRVKLTKEPGKVDAYRFMTFYLEPHARNFEDFFGRVVDPIWLQGSDPAAAALRQVELPSGSAGCWRLFHRVTFVSRVLDPAGAPPASLEAKLPRLDIDSNYELLRQLEPYLAVAVWETSAELQEAVEAALRAAHLEELLGNSREIAGFMENYLARGAFSQPR